ncbi:MAG: PolC-type DNA polymerase III N-terminal domain-containing protein, partial [Erysipelotrichaceae bacterium]|nr:PolC-type DNA polymerase III N-terminal domain-containing protein [Erysipelotrichaceae bacterium]
MKDVKLYKILKMEIINEYSDFLEEVEILREILDKNNKELDIYFKSLTMFPYRLYKLIEASVK